MEDAIAALEQAVALEDALTYDEPEPLPFAARDWLGAALLDAGRAADAERVYRAALDDRPHNGWSLFGLEQALRAQGRTRGCGRGARPLPRGLGALGRAAGSLALLKGKALQAEGAETKR